MVRIKGGRWSGRPGMSEIENQAVRLVAEFQRQLAEAGLEAPPVPPVPVEYLALTVTDFSVRGVKGLECDGQKLSGFLDTENEEICYEEDENQARQNFTIAHELGHYYLHYRPILEMANQPTLFELEEVSPMQHARFYRCSEQEIAPTVGDDTEEEGEESGSVRVTHLNKTALDDAETQAKLAKIIRLKERANRYEWEANVFAAGLLMPRDLVRWLNQKHGGDIRLMSKELGVSQAALRYRLHGMKLVSTEQAFQGNNSSRQKSSKNPSKNDLNQGTFF